MFAVIRFCDGNAPEMFSEERAQSLGCSHKQMSEEYGIVTFRSTRRGVSTPGYRYERLPETDALMLRMIRVAVGVEPRECWLREIFTTWSGSKWRRYQVDEESILVYQGPMHHFMMHETGWRPSLKGQSEAHLFFDVPMLLAPLGLQNIIEHRIRELPE